MCVGTLDVKKRPRTSRLFLSTRTLQHRAPGKNKKCRAFVCRKGYTCTATFGGCLYLPRVCLNFSHINTHHLPNVLQKTLSTAKHRKSMQGMIQKKNRGRESLSTTVVGWVVQSRQSIVRRNFQPCKNNGLDMLIWGKTLH